jgi:hypothetical protein
MVRVLLESGSDLPWEGLPIAVGHLHNLHVTAILYLGDEPTGPKSDRGHDGDRSTKECPHPCHHDNDELDLEAKTDDPEGMLVIQSIPPIRLTGSPRGSPWGVLFLS